MTFNRIRCACCVEDPPPCIFEGEESDCPDSFTLTVTVPAPTVKQGCDCTFTTGGWTGEVTLNKVMTGACVWAGTSTPYCTTDTHCVDPRESNIGCWRASDIFSGIDGGEIHDNNCWSAQSWGGCDCRERIGSQCQASGVDKVERKDVYMLHTEGGGGDHDPIIYEYWCGCSADVVPTTPCGSSGYVGQNPLCEDGTCCERCGECSNQPLLFTQMYGGVGTLLWAKLSWNYHYDRFVLTVKTMGQANFAGIVASCDGTYGSPIYQTPQCMNYCLGDTSTSCENLIESDSTNLFLPYNIDDFFTSWDDPHLCPFVDPFSLIANSQTTESWVFDPSILPTNCTDLDGLHSASSSVEFAKAHCPVETHCDAEDYRGYFNLASPFSVNWTLDLDS